MREIVAAGPGSWPDIEALFGANGADGGCWCMFWRLPGPQFHAQAGAGTHEMLRELLTTGAEPGLLAYTGDRPDGWIAVAPRAEHRRLDRSPLRKAMDLGETGVWTVSCFYIGRAARGTGLAAELLAAAVEHAAGRGARAVEGFPKDTGARLSRAELYVGWPGLFTDAGFREVGRPTPTRPIMRRDL